MVHKIESLDMHAAHSCNLACVSCSHFSNHGHAGLLSVEDAENWMRPWRGRLRPELLSILGGEPTINPAVTAIFRVTRTQFHSAMIRIITNGFFLYRHPDLPRVLRDDPDGWLYLSVHHDSPSYLETITPIVDLLETWSANYGIKLVVFRSFEDWTVRYKGFGDSMEPFEDNEPHSSWMNCPAKNCRQLFEGKIWRCPPLTYLGLQSQRFRLSPKWNPYLTYRPLEPSCSDEELTRFLRSEHDSYCNMCPAKPQRIRPPLPLRIAPRPPRDRDGGARSHTVFERLDAISTQDPRHENLQSQPLALSRGEQSNAEHTE